MSERVSEIDQNTSYDEHFTADNLHMNMTSFKCRFCQECSGTGCIGELPGMGGIRSNINFQLNCAAWESFSALEDAFNLGILYSELENLPRVRLAPITGAVENVGYYCEEAFYNDITKAAHEAGILLSIGDGCPDYKIQYGIRAVETLRQTDSSVSAAVFIKPYSNDRILERVQWAGKSAGIIGIDIDSYNIATMRRLVRLEKKTSFQLSQIKEQIDVPFAVKGIFTEEDIEIVKEVKPDIVVVSNHGGRVENRTGSTAQFLYEYGAQLAQCCSEIWIDGGIRRIRDLHTAKRLGASEVMIGRPFITALCRGVPLTLQNVLDTDISKYSPAPLSFTQ